MHVGKIGVGLLTFNRESYFKKVYKALEPCNFDELVIVNDGTPYKFKPPKGHLVQHDKTYGIARTKNDALRFLNKTECDHYFLIEDDILIKNPHVFKEYISIAKATGLQHLNFEQAAPNFHKFDVNYGEGVTISFWHNPQGAFSYFDAKIIKGLGMFDEEYMNAFEHIDFIVRLSMAKLAPPFWFNPDIANSTEFLESIKGSNENSTITDKGDYSKNWNKSAQHFIQKYGRFTSEIREAKQTEVASSLRLIYENYSKNEIVPNNQQL